MSIHGKYEIVERRDLIEVLSAAWSHLDYWSALDDPNNLATQAFERVLAAAQLTIEEVQS